VKIDTIWQIGSIYPSAQDGQPHSRHADRLESGHTGPGCPVGFQVRKQLKTLGETKIAFSLLDLENPGSGYGIFPGPLQGALIPAPGPKTRAAKGSCQM